MIYDLILCV